MVVGYTYSEGASDNADILIVKLDANGTKSWMKVLIGFSNDALSKVVEL